MLRPARYRSGWWPMPAAHSHFLRCPAYMLDVQRRMRQAKLMAAARLADYLVVDCSFADESHVSLEHYHAKLHLKIHSCFTSLYRYHSPSFLLLCNAPSREKTTWLHNSPYCHATSLTYVDLFARERLVYLSPDSPNVMSEYDHSAVYILGGLFQRTRNERLTLEKAKHEGIRHQSLPLQQYLRLSASSSTVLSLNQVYNILMTLKHTRNNWSAALKCVPEHFLVR